MGIAWKYQSNPNNRLQSWQLLRPRNNWNALDQRGCTDCLPTTFAICPVPYVILRKTTPNTSLPSPRDRLALQGSMYRDPCSAPVAPWPCPRNKGFPLHTCFRSLGLLGAHDAVLPADAGAASVAHGGLPCAALVATLGPPGRSPTLDDHRRHPLGEARQEADGMTLAG